MRITENLALIAGLQYGLAGPFDCNVYAIGAPGGLVLIDSGGGVDSALLLERLRWSFPGERAAAILLTHAHPDHAAGAGLLRAALNVPVMAPAASAAMIERADEEAMGLRGGKESGIYPSDFQLAPCPIDRRVSDGERFTPAGLEFEACLVRGHSVDSTVYLATIGGLRHAFVGDVVFYGGVLGLTTAVGSDLAHYRHDLPKLAGLGIDVFCPGHGMFALRDGQKHIDFGIEAIRGNFLPRMIGQWDRIL